jgi:hypothetical protein
MNVTFTGISPLPGGGVEIGLTNGRSILIDSRTLGIINSIAGAGANSEETGKWVIVDHFPHSPSEVYGLFDSEGEALVYAKRQRFGENGGAFDVRMVLNAHYIEESDPVAMGWVGRDGRP